MDFHRHRWCLLGNRSDFAALRFPKSTCCRSRANLYLLELHYRSFLYTNFEPATALRVTNHRPDLNKKYTILVYFLFKLVVLGIRFSNRIEEIDELKDKLIY
jgi:hypothetical protein